METEDRPTRSLARPQGFGTAGAPAPADFGPGAMMPTTRAPLVPAMANPAGAAALGGGVGVLAGNVVAGLINLLVIAPRLVRIQMPAVGEADDPDESEAAAQAEAQRILSEVAQLRRVAHTVSAGLGVLGGAVGAYVAADEVEKRSAAIGAAVGTAAFKAINVGLNPALGLPGILAGAGGAYLGARRAVSRIS